MPDAAARDHAYYVHPYTNLAAHQNERPLVIERGDGVYVVDQDGKRYLEAMAGLWCASLGFSEKRLAEAAYRQMLALPFYHSFGGKVPAITLELSEALIKLAPVPMGKALFASSGSESNDTAVKLVWYLNNALGRPQKKKIIARQKGYHGVTVASASLTGLPAVHADFDLPLPQMLHADCPHYYRFGGPGEAEEAFAERMAHNLEAMILREGPDTVAAFIAEPIQGAGGVILPPATYFERIQPILKKYDLLFIVDEVICGFGRTGHLFGSDLYGLRPDLMTVAKAISAGYQPISALLMSEEVSDVLVRQSTKLGAFGHGYTYTGHPVPAAVALETLRIYEQDRILDHVRAVGPLLQEGLRAFSDHPLVGHVRGVGLIAAVELVQDKSTRASFPAGEGVGTKLARIAQEDGLIVRVMAGDIIAFSPPLIIDAAEIRVLLERFERALDATLVWSRGRGLVAAGH
jgi:4-aminobutyrate---pyruvate transaminase